MEAGRSASELDGSRRQSAAAAGRARSEPGSPSSPRRLPALDAGHTDLHEAGRRPAPGAPNERAGPKKRALRADGVGLQGPRRRPDTRYETRECWKAMQGERGTQGELGREALRRHSGMVFTFPSRFTHVVIGLRIRPN